MVSTLRPLMIAIGAFLALISCTGQENGGDGSTDPFEVPEGADIDPAADDLLPGEDPAESPDVPPAEEIPETPAEGDPSAEDLPLDLPDGVCPDVPPPEPVSASPLPGETPPGRTESTTVDGFQDDYLYDNLDYIKIGVRREWGGTVIFYGLADGTGPGTNPNNVIDANDTGREVQLAFYDPDRSMQNCAWNASCATTPSSCPSSITYLGWDPVQGGNRCNRGSGVESVSAAGGVLTVTTNPLFWNPNWDRSDCSSDACSDPVLRDRRSDVRVIQSIVFIKRHVAQIDYTVINLSDLDHRSTAQEMPTVYTANGNNGPDLWRLFNSEGVEIPIDTFAGGDGFYYENFDSPGGWAAMQNDAANYGVGLYAENRLASWQAWQLRSLPFNNFRPLAAFGIPPFGVVRARAYLILGSRDTVAAEAAWLDVNLPPFGWLDVPADDEAVADGATIAGWALDNKGVTAVELVVDGAAAVPLAYGGSRPDVCAVWPQYPGCDLVGFGGTLDTSALTPCGHILEIRASDADGNVRVIARRRIFVSP